MAHSPSWPGRTRRLAFLCLEFLQVATPIPSPFPCVTLYIPFFFLLRARLNILRYTSEEAMRLLLLQAEYSALAEKSRSFL